MLLPIDNAARIQYTVHRVSKFGPPAYGTNFVTSQPISKNLPPLKKLLN